MISDRIMPLGRKKSSDFNGTRAPKKPALPHLKPSIVDWITLDLHYCCLFFLMISIDIPFYGVSSRFQLVFFTFLSMTASIFLIDGAGCSNFMVIKDDKGR